jgi:hypothetical protein
MTPTNPNEVNHGTGTGSSDLCGAEVRVRESAGEAGPNLLANRCASGPEETPVSDVSSIAPAKHDARQGGGYSTDAAGGVDTQGAGSVSDPGSVRWTQEQQDVAIRLVADKAREFHPEGYLNHHAVSQVAFDLACQRNELLEVLKTIQYALSEKVVDAVPPWFPMREWLRARDIYEGDFQGERVILEVVNTAIAKAVNCG